MTRIGRIGADKAKPKIRGNPRHRCSEAEATGLGKFLETAWEIKFSPLG